MRDLRLKLTGGLVSAILAVFQLTLRGLHQRASGFLAPPPKCISRRAVDDSIEHTRTYYTTGRLHIRATWEAESYNIDFYV